MEPFDGDRISRQVQASLSPKPITVDLAQVPTAISESIAAVLAAHGFAIVRAADTQNSLDDKRLAALFKELGNNVAMAVACCDVEAA